MTTLESFLGDYRRSRQLEPIVLDEPVPIESLHTPALIIDLDRYEANLSKMQRFVDDRGIMIRPHTKMHKCPIIAKQQLSAGAVGVCAAKLGEAEIMCDAGVTDVLVTSPVVTSEKLERYTRLAAEYPTVKIVVDNPDNVKKLDELAAAEGIKSGVFVDVDPGLGRTGIEAGEKTLLLSEQVLASEHLTFHGLQMYAGHCMHIEGFDKRRLRYEKVMAAGLETRSLFEQKGIDIPVFTGGGTGSYNMESGLGLINELQAGSYIFMDIEYRDIGGEGASLFEDFDVSLFVLVSAISQPQSRLITVDGGFKSFASDKMPPEFRDVEGVLYHWGGDEHGIIQLDNPSRMIDLGDKLPMLTPHCDPTVNLHDYYYPVRDGMVSEIWPISARGFSQ